MSMTIATSTPAYTPQYLPTALIRTAPRVVVVPALQRLADAEVAAIETRKAQEFLDAQEDAAYHRFIDLAIILHARHNLRQGLLPYAPCNWPLPYGVPPRAHIVLDPDYATYCDVRSRAVKRQALPFRRGKELVLAYHQGLRHGPQVATYSDVRTREVRELLTYGGGDALPFVISTRSQRGEAIIARIKEALRLGARYVDPAPTQGPREARFTPRFTQRQLLTYDAIQVTHLGAGVVLTDYEPSADQDGLFEKAFVETKANGLSDSELTGIMAGDAILADGCAHCGLAPAKCLCLDALIDAPRLRVYYELNANGGRVRVERWECEKDQEVGYAGPTDDSSRHEELRARWAYHKEVERLANARADELGDTDSLRTRLTALNQLWSALRLEGATRDDDIIQTLELDEWRIAEMLNGPAEIAALATRRSLELAEDEPDQKKIEKLERRIVRGTNNDQVVAERCTAVRAREAREAIADERFPSWRTWRKAPAFAPHFVARTAIVAGHIARLHRVAGDGELAAHKADRALRAALAWQQQQEVA